MIIDTHCHIDLYKNPEKILSECELRGISVISMTNLPSHFEQGFPYFEKTRKCRIALGLHPLHATAHNSEFASFEKNLEKTSYIGEVGLDFSKEGINSKDIQLESFNKLLSLISGQKKILSIHSRGAETKVLELLIKYKIKNAIFHWYTGPSELINNIVDYGYYFSINSAMINSKKGQINISQIPLDNILTETDGPFIQYQNNPVMPWNLNIVIEAIAKIKKTEYLIIEKSIFLNFRKIINSLK
jgi:TatD DNase family protein